jgi:hypothetical protein
MGSGLICFRALSIFLLIFPFLATIKMPQTIQTSDFLTSFYVAGRLVHDGRITDLYPEHQASSMFNTHFNTFAHEVLPNLPASTLAVYMYFPITTLLFVWLSCLPPQVAILIWQGLSVLALAICTKIFASITDKRWSDYFWICPFFLPILHMIWIGQLGIVAGLLPLSLGFWFLIRGKRFLAGLIWALLLLKPQLLPIAFLLIGSLALIGQMQSALGFTAGAALLLAITLAYFGMGAIHSWFLALKLSDAIFSDKIYGYPQHLVASLPAAISQILPIQFAKMAKPVLYLLSAAISLHALIKCYLLIKGTTKNALTKSLPIVFIVGVCILPLISPHFLLYDLSVFFLAGILIYVLPASRINNLAKRSLLFNWIFINTYLVLVMFMSPKFGQSLLLVATLSWLYWRVLKILDHEISAKHITDQI